MTVHIGDHVHALSAPDVELVVDAVAEQHWDSAWLSTHDLAGHKVYLAAEDAERHPRHRTVEEVVLAAPVGIARGVLTNPHMGIPWFGGLR